MLYALLIYSPPAQSEPTPEQYAAIAEQYNAFTRDVRAADVMRGGEELHDTKMATTVRIRDGRTLVTDGPFAETKEEFGGFYLLDVPDLDEAIKWASRIPGAQWGSIEVRPIVEVRMTQPQPAGAAAAG